jgi:cytochrome c-type biogenesis protein CcmH
MGAMIWVVFGVLTLVAMLAVLLPLARRRPAFSGPDGKAIYETEIAGIDRDVARGLASEADAAAAKTEAARRFLATTAVEQKPVRSSTFARRAAAVVALLFIPGLTFGLYRAIGAADYPDQPLEARLNAPASGSDINVALAKIEKRLAEQPDDARGWEVVAPVYLKMDRPRDAARAWQKVIQLEGVTAERAASFGEALVYADEGRISPQARKAFEAALEQDASEPRAQFFLGMADEQAGDNAGAIQRWTRLLDGAPADAPFAPAVRERIAALSARPAAAAGPDSALGQSVAAMSAEDQQKFMRERVEGLAARLRQGGGGAREWEMLVTSYAKLGDADKAREALANARQALAGDATAAGELDGLAGQLGLSAP